MAGLLDFEDPQQAGLLAFAQNMFAAGAPQTRRVGIGEALAGGLGGMQQAQLQAEMLKRKKAQDDMEMQVNQMKFGQMQQEVAKQKAMEDAMVNYAKFKQGGTQPTKQAAQVEAPSSVRGFSMPTAQSQNDRVNGSYTPQAPLLKMPTQETQQAPAPKTFSKGDLVKSQISELMKEAEFYGSRPDYQSQVLAQQAQAKAIKLANEMPKFGLDYKVVQDPKTGEFRNVRLADDGTEMFSNNAVAEDLHFTDTGQKVIGVGKLSGKEKAAFQKSQSLESIANNATQRRGQDLMNDRSKEANEIAANNKMVDLSTSLRKEFEGLPEVKNYKEAVPAYKAVVDASKRDTPQANINLVYGIAKMYDPTSVVREGEYATIVNSANIPDKIKGYAQYLAGGGKFTPEVKAALVKEAEGRMQSFDDQFKKARMDFENISQNSGAKPSLLFPKPFAPTVPQASGKWSIEKVN